MLAWNGSLASSAFRVIVGHRHCVYGFRFGNRPCLPLPAPIAERQISCQGGVDRCRAKPPDADTDDLDAIVFACPSLPEQTAIVRFLDYADRRIRRYIRAKQKLIKLLEEQKQAIIHRAVTRGLDPNVRLKPSGVEWLGDVPEHWEVSSVKCRVRAVATRSRVQR